MEFADAIKYGFKNYANFKGVVDRKTFWWWRLFVALVWIACETLNIAFQVTSQEAGRFVSLLFSLSAIALYLPSLALKARRLRDVGTNPLFLLFGLLPGVLIVIGVVAGGLLGAVAGGGGYWSLGGATAGVLLGTLPGLLAGLGFGIWMLVLFTQPTRTAAQGNKYAS